MYVAWRVADLCPHGRRPDSVPVTDDALSRHWPGFLAGETQVRDRLVEAYDDDDRGYHDLTHLAEVLERVRELLDVLEPGDVTDQDAVLLAAWFHDAVYDTGGSGTQGDDAGSMEERSALAAERELETIAVSGPLVDEVARLVRVTERHDPADDDLAGQVLCDADLAILAADPARYAAYVAGVRAEHEDLSDGDFAAGRAAVLRDLAARERLFSTAYARERWEPAARANLRRELHELAGARPTDPATD